MNNINDLSEILHRKLLDDISTIKHSEKVALNYARQCIEVCLNAFSSLKELVKTNDFSTVREEIEFFKTIKPKFHSQLIYYSKLYDIELKKPAGSTAYQSRYYEKHLVKIRLFFENHTDIYQYYRMGATLFDELFFQRTKQPPLISEHYRMIDADPTFTSPKDYLISQIMANDLLELYLKKVLVGPDGSAKPIPPGNEQKTLKWKGPKVGLIEFGYACKEAGILDESLHEIFECFEKLFSVQLGNTSRTFQEILSRKKEESAFLDKLSTKFQERVVKVNQNYQPRK